MEFVYVGPFARGIGRPSLLGSGLFTTVRTFHSFLPAILRFDHGDQNPWTE